MESYIIAGIIVFMCIIVIIIGLRILKETRKMQPKKMDPDEDELKKIRRRRL